jgi:hypothetical protein
LEAVATPDNAAPQRAAAIASGPIAYCEALSDLPSPRDAPSSYSPAFVSQLRGQLLHTQHQLYAQAPMAALAARDALRRSLEKAEHVDNVTLLREQLQSLQTRLSTLQGWRMKELSDEQVDAVSEEVRDAMRA